MTENVEQVVDDKAVVAEQVATVAKETEADVEGEARAMGWLPESEYTGDKSRWKPADEFVKVGRERLPVMRERLDTQTKTIKALETGMKQLTDWKKQAEEEGYNRALGEIKASMKAAVETGDTKAFEEAEKQLDEQLKKQPTKQVEAPQMAPEIEQFRTDNPWYLTKTTPSQRNIMAQFLNEAEEEGLTLEEGLAQGRERLLQLYPNLVAKGAKTRAPNIEPARNPTNRTITVQKGFKDLDEDTQVVAKSMVRMGVFKSTDDYAKAYFANPKMKG